MHERCVIKVSEYNEVSCKTEYEDKMKLRWVRARREKIQEVQSRFRLYEESLEVVDEAGVTRIREEKVVNGKMKKLRG